MSKATFLEQYKGNYHPVANLAGDESKLKVGSTEMVLPDHYVGVELEVENFPMDKRHQLAGFNFTNDNSLRNNGMEVITVPTRAKFLEWKLLQFVKKFELGDDNYSERCSTHVHVNMQDATTEQLKTVSILYQVFERLLFRYVGNNRSDGIFCVPWFQAGMNYRVAKNLDESSDGAIRKWQKYTALNLLPIRDKGTIEFRQLEGTCDVSRILQWINLCLCLVKFAQEISFGDTKKLITALNTISNYDDIVGNVFGKYSGVFRAMSGYETDLTAGVIDVKMMCIHEKDSPKKSLYQQLVADGVAQARAEELARDAEEHALMFDDDEEDDFDRPPADPWPAPNDDEIARIVREAQQHRERATLDRLAGLQNVAVPARPQPVPRVRNPFAQIVANNVVVQAQNAGTTYAEWVARNNGGNR